MFAQAIKVIFDFRQLHGPHSRKCGVLRMSQVSQRLLWVTVLTGIFIHSCRGQDLAPRAYFITPLRSNAITLTESFFDGSIDYNGVIPISDATGTYNIPTLSYYHSFGIFGRSANVVASLPYGVGNFKGTVGTEMQVYRSGLLDSVYRVSVNLLGGPAMPVEKFMKWKQKTVLGVSLKVIAPTGQYDPTKLINWGTNRWSFKPELGYSQAWGKWVLDAYSGVWLFTENPEFWSRNLTYPGTRTQSQKPIVAFEGHVSYDFKPRLWVSLDGNYWFGGTTSLDGAENSLTQQANSRIGATVSVPISKHQSLKTSYSNGTYIRFGGNYQNVSVAWQYSWLGRPN
jgi:Putative MetA-pathway of phenol degradation